LIFFGDYKRITFKNRQEKHRNVLNKLNTKAYSSANTAISKIVHKSQKYRRKPTK